MIAFTTPIASAAPATLDDELGRIVSSTYHRLTKPATDIDWVHIHSRAENAYNAQDYLGALHILAANHALNTAHLDAPEQQPIIRLALQLYCHTQVEQLLAEAQRQANSSAEARLAFELARFYAANEHWLRVSKLLSDDSIFDQLTKTDRSEALVLLGSALQKQKKHRETIRIYGKVNAGSEHFRLAQLNLAAAYIRQDWWTDAHTAINSALKENTGKRDALDYRLFTMLGYSQIQFGFYRDARESFRNVAIASQYFQRALLGLGVAALHQQDFIGALNAFDKLRALPQQDISTAEAYLLSAFTLRQLEQFDAATSRYQEAIDYYQKLSADINAQINSTTPIALHFLRPEHSADKLLRNNTRKKTLLAALSQASPGAQEAAAIANLQTKLSSETSQHAGNLLREEKTVIDSYLSQSQFGLASLYDKK
jgi:tetratricopeptide (TPR) repeat protein